MRIVYAYKAKWRLTKWSERNYEAVLWENALAGREPTRAEAVKAN